MQDGNAIWQQYGANGDGSGHSHLEEAMGVLGVPVMSWYILG